MAEMKLKLDELETIIRQRICSICDTRTVEGACGARERENCSLLTLFPLVAEAVMATDSNDPRAYVEAIHENVCSVCMDQRLDGSCPQRVSLSCALDAHMPEIIDAIEAALGRPFRPGRASAVPAL
jgi:hypothetical protein